MSEHDEKPPTGFPEPPGRDPDDRTGDAEPHHVLNNPVGAPDPTEWPDPYEDRPDPRDPAGDDPADPDHTRPGQPPHAIPGAVSTSEPNPKQDPEAQPWAEGPKRDKVDR